VTAVTNYHKRGGLKAPKCILSQCWRPEVQNQDWELSCGKMWKYCFGVQYSTHYSSLTVTKSHFCLTGKTHSHIPTSPKVLTHTINFQAKISFKQHQLKSLKSHHQNWVKNTLGMIHPGENSSPLTCDM